MKIYKRKTGEWVTWQEFFRQWKEGMKNVTPLQQAIGTQLGQVVTLIGIIWGIIFSVITNYWWMMAILIGGLIALGFQMLSIWQRIQVLKEMENMFSQAEPFKIQELEEVKNVVG